MKFLLVVLAVHLIGEWISRYRNRGDDGDNMNNTRVIHPAEFNIR